MLSRKTTMLLTVGAIVRRAVALLFRRGELQLSA
jgi:hypothetical protein